MQGIFVLGILFFWRFQMDSDFSITQKVLTLLYEVRNLCFRTLYTTSFRYGFRLAVDLHAKYLRKAALFTKSAFCRELKSKHRFYTLNKWNFHLWITSFRDFTLHLKKHLLYFNSIENLIFTIWMYDRL